MGEITIRDLARDRSGNSGRYFMVWELACFDQSGRNVSAIRQTGRFSCPPESGWQGKSQCDLSGAAVIACPGF